MLMKEYMDDGIYIEDRGYDVLLTTEDGISIQNEIAIDRITWQSIERYMKFKIEEDSK